MDGRQSSKSLLVGSIVQLQHRSSGRFLASRMQQTQSVAENNLELKLEKSASKRCWWKVLPGNSRSQEGDKAR